MFKLFVNKYFIRNNTPNEYHTCHIQLSLNVHRIRFRPTQVNLGLTEWIKAVLTVG